MKGKGHREGKMVGEGPSRLGTTTTKRIEGRRKREFEKMRAGTSGEKKRRGGGGKSEVKGKGTRKVECWAADVLRRGKARESHCGG